MDDLSTPASIWAFKGWPNRPSGSVLDEVVAESLNIFEDDFLFPVATISEGDLEHNIETMARFCQDNDVSLAPHAKTTMSPEIIDRQLKAGAWAITAATVSQARTFRQFGVDRILIAHEVVDPAAVRWIALELDSHPQAEIMCLVDSLDAVHAMNGALAGSQTQRPVDVLVELGVSGGRTGCRTVTAAVEVAEAVTESANLRLVGVEGYEGVLSEADDVDAFLNNVCDLTESLDALNLFDGLEEVVVTAGGSMFPDRAVAVLEDLASLSRPTRVVIRSGCYVTHDSVMYLNGGPFGVRAPMDTYPTLRPAMMVWAYVVSRPEPDLAIVGFGKRDASYDIDLPKPLEIRRGDTHTPVDGELELFELNDQHGFVRVSPGFEISVGDIVGCGISHPCTTFDKWRAIPLIDPEFKVVGAVRTFF